MKLKIILDEESRLYQNLETRRIVFIYVVLKKSEKTTFPPQLYIQKLATMFKLCRKLAPPKVRAQRSNNIKMLRHVSKTTEMKRWEKAQNSAPLFSNNS